MTFFGRVVVTVFRYVPLHKYDELLQNKNFPRQCKQYRVNLIIEENYYVNFYYYLCITEIAN